MSSPLLKVYLKKGLDKRLKLDFPWVYTDQINNYSSIIISEGTEIAHLYNFRNEFIATAIINKSSKIALRVIDNRYITTIDTQFFARKFKTAMERRIKINESKYYRLINYEGDFLPGLCIEKFGTHFRIESNIKFYYCYRDLILKALLNIFKVESVVMFFENQFEILYGKQPEYTIIKEGNCKFYVNPVEGQKTGWYFDQRENRQLIASLSDNKVILDCYCYTGGFGINALLNKAKHVNFIDSSKLAIENLKRNLQLNNLKSSTYNIFIDDAQQVMLKMLNLEHKYDLIILDPPPFVKNKTNKNAAIKKHSKLVMLALKLLKDRGYIFYSSCSHYLYMTDLKKIFQNNSLLGNNCSINIIKTTTHPYDHPIHPHLSETLYLNSILIQKL